MKKMHFLCIFVQAVLLTNQTDICYCSSTNIFYQGILKSTIMIIFQNFQTRYYYSFLVTPTCDTTVSFLFHEPLDPLWQRQYILVYPDLDNCFGGKNMILFSLNSAIFYPNFKCHRLYVIIHRIHLQISASQICSAIWIIFEFCRLALQFIYIA